MPTKTKPAGRAARLRESRSTVRAALDDIDASPADLAEAIGVSRSTVTRWLAGERILSAAARRALEAVVKEWR